MYDSCYLQINIPFQATIHTLQSMHTETEGTVLLNADLLLFPYSRLQWIISLAGSVLSRPVRVVWCQCSTPGQRTARPSPSRRALLQLFRPTSEEHLKRLRLTQTPNICPITGSYSQLVYKLSIHIYTSSVICILYTNN
jgi:hypothetical protein